MKFAVDVTDWRDVKPEDKTSREIIHDVIREAIELAMNDVEEDENIVIRVSVIPPPVKTPD